MSNRNNTSKWIIALAVVAMVGLAAPAQSEAGFELSLSVGGNYDLLVNNPQASDRVGVNLELMPSYRLSFISFDLGIHYDFLKKAMLLRPGVRLYLGWFYFRVGLPFAFAHNVPADDMFNFGFLGGVGVRVKLQKVLLSLEANISPYIIKIDERGVRLPAEVRLGVGYAF